MKKIIKRTVLVFAGVILLLVLYIAFLVYEGGKISEGNRIAPYPNTKTALFVIDIQEGTTGNCSNYQAYVDQAEELITTVNGLLAYCDSLRIPLVYIKQETEHPVVKFLTNNALAKGSPSADIDKRISVVSDHIFSKPVQDAFSNPELDEFLIANQINRLLITGLDADACVGATIKAADNRGYEIIVVEDGIISGHDEDKQRKLKEFKEKGFTVLPSSAIPTLLTVR